MMLVDVGKNRKRLTVISDEDYPLVANRTISMTTQEYCYLSNYYGRDLHARLHRLIAERMIGRTLNDDEIVDHINGIVIDNRRQNLRVTDNSGNMRNMKKHRNGHKHGVTRHGERWKSQRLIDGKVRHLGVFDTEKEAHDAFMKHEQSKG